MGSAEERVASGCRFFEGAHGKCKKSGGDPARRAFGVCRAEKRAIVCDTVEKEETEDDQGKSKADDRVAYGLEPLF